MRPTPAQSSQLRETISAARAGRAALPQLAAAHDLAREVGLPGCEAELRGHLMAKLGRPPRASGRSLGGEVALGVATGALTHYLLKGL